MEVQPVSPPACLRIERGDVLGVNVSAITMDDAIATIECWIREGRREYVCITGVHGSWNAAVTRRCARFTIKRVW
jgi:N-acetylglucosaminyldiphosphoundecaprenol N-acetyl-beta-D-mannosaminyltransferase